MVPNPNESVRPSTPGIRCQGPGNLAQWYGQWIRTLVICVAWTTTMLAALTAAYLTVRGLLVLVSVTHHALGI